MAKKRKRNRSLEHGRSPFEKTFVYYLQKIATVTEHYRPKWMDGKELDIFLPELNIAIECDSGWHRNRVNEDKIKDQLCIENGVDIIHVREDGLPIIEGMTSFLVTPYKYTSVDETVRKVIAYVNKHKRYPSADVVVDSKADRESILKLYEADN